MTSEREEQGRTPAQRATRDALRELPRPRADDAFRARLRHEFVSGRIGRRRGLPAAAPWFARPVFVAALSAGFVLVAAWAANLGPDWRVVSAEGDGRVVVDGVSFATGDVAGMGARLGRGARLQVQGAVTLDLVAPGVAAVALAPGADVTLSPPPNRWWLRGMEAQLATGDAYFSTGRAFHGAHIDVRTPDATVRAVGTSFAVLCAPIGTCVCVMEGHVNVAGKAVVPGGGVDVPHGMRRVVSPDQVAETLPILEDSVHHLHHQLSIVGEVLERQR